MRQPTSLAALLGLGLASCSGADPAESTGASTSTTATTRSDPATTTTGLATTSTGTPGETTSTTTTTSGSSTTSASGTTDLTSSTGGSTTTTGNETDSSSTSTTGELACLTWEVVEGGLDADYVNEVVRLDGAGFALAGRTKSKGAGLDDFWLLRLSEEGDVLADFTYGGAGQEVANTVAFAPDDSALLAGIVATQENSVDGLMIGVSSDGDKLWELQLGDSDADHLMAAIPVGAGGFAVAGIRDRVAQGTGYFWLVRVDGGGGLLWTKTYGDDSDEQLAYDLVETEDGGFALAGTNAGDFWLVRTNADGQLKWDKTYGGPRYERALGVDLFEDGGFAIGGWAEENGASDFYLVRTDAAGDAVWQTTLDGDHSDLAEDVRVLDDGGVLVVGATRPDGGTADLWMAKVDALGASVWDHRYGGSAYDGGRSVTEAASGDLVVVGRTDSKGAGMADAWALRTAPNGDLRCP